MDYHEKIEASEKITINMLGRFCAKQRDTNPIIVVLLEDSINNYSANILHIDGLFF
jgi:hypothetical protein